MLFFRKISGINLVPAGSRFALGESEELLTGLKASIVNLRASQRFILLKTGSVINWET